MQQGQEDWIRKLAEQALSRSAGAPLKSGHQVRLLIDSTENFPAWIEALQQATSFIAIEMYLIEDDPFGRQLRDVLIERARAGVRVYLLHDWLGCLKAALSGFFTPLRHAGAAVRAYNPPSLASGVGLFERNHRKLLIIDGETVFIGGLCISARWQGHPASDTPWRDTGIMLRGPAAHDALAAFADSWSASGGTLPPLQGKETTRGEVNLRLIATTPATARMMRLDLLVAGFARHTLWLTDAYFMGTSVYLQALRQAALDGVDVRLLVPHASDIGWIATISRTLYRPLLEAGIRVYEWDGPMIHAKTAVADGRWARVGSTNLNISSWLANREIDVAIEDETFAGQMQQQFLEDIAHATEIVLSGKRTVPLSSRPRQKGLRDTYGRTVKSVSAAARQAARIGDALGAVVRGTRAVEHSESAAFITIGLCLLLLTAGMLFFPYLVVIPLAILAGASGIGILLRGYGLRRGRWTKKQHPPA